MRCRGVAESSPAAIKRLCAPQVAVYDGMNSVDNTIIELT
jgi:hypothetical protein